MINNCIFCEIVGGREKSYKVWENETHMAFLSKFPNTPGVTVVIPKEHKSSYIFDHNEMDMLNLMSACKIVAKMIDKNLDGVGRTGLIFEGYGVSHLHAKLFPMHGTGNSSDFKKISSNVNLFFDEYKGYLSSHDFKEESHDNLEKMKCAIVGMSND